MSLMEICTKNPNKILLQGDCSSESGYEPETHDHANYVIFKMAQENVMVAWNNSINWGGWPFCCVSSYLKLFLQMCLFPLISILTLVGTCTYSLYAAVVQTKGWCACCGVFVAVAIGCFWNLARNQTLRCHYLLMSPFHASPPNLLSSQARNRCRVPAKDGRTSGDGCISMLGRSGKTFSLFPCVMEVWGPLQMQGIACWDRWKMKGNHMLFFLMIQQQLCSVPF